MTSSTVSKGETVLVTGSTGWLGSHIAEVALQHGLHVRLASRSQERVQPLVDSLGSTYGKSKVDVAIVPDFAAKGAYDEAIKGVKGVIHAASDVTFSDDYDAVVGASLKGYQSMLDAASKAPDVKRVVFTSSSIALGNGNPNGKETQHLNRESWNDVAVQKAQAGERDPLTIYAASKVITERRVWDFVKENKPHFTVNVVNPNFIMGAKVPGFQYGSTGQFLRQALLNGDMTIPNMIGPQYHIDAYDAALLHVLALTRPDIANERILAYSETFTWSQLIDLAKEFRPDLPNPPQKTEQTDAQENTVIDLERTKETLKEYGGLKGLRHSAEGNLARD